MVCGGSWRLSVYDTEVSGDHYDGNYMDVSTQAQTKKKLEGNTDFKAERKKKVFRYIS